jgi:hypothetical protein
VDRVARVQELWESLARGELAPLQAALEPAARWRAVEDGPWNCESAPAIVDVMRHNLETGRSEGRIEESFALGDRVLVAFRPTNNPNPAWPLEDGLRWMVVTFAGDRVAELKGCATRADVLSYAAAG